MDIFAYSMLCFTSLFTLMAPPRSDAGFPADDRGHECRRTPEHRLKILRPHVRHTGTFHLVRQVPVPFFRDLDQWFPDCGRYHHL